MNFFKNFILLFFLLALSGISAPAQESGGVKGKVRTPSGEGIGGAAITARQNGEDVKSTTSDAKGNFQLDGLKPGTYNLVFSKNGYSSGLLTNVEIKRNKISNLSDRLFLTVDQGTQVIVRGSVFDQAGRSIGGADVKIERILSDGTVKRVGAGTASYSGEFTFRFSEGAAKFRVTASAKGKTASKEIEVSSAAVYRLAITLEL